MAAPDQPASASASTSAFYDALAPVYDRWQRAGGMTPFSEVARAKLLPALERFAAELGARGAEAAPPPQPIAGEYAFAFADVGCGTGDLLLGLGRAHPRWRLVGLDGSAGMLEIARAKPRAERVHWIQGALVAPAGALAAPALPPPPLDAVGCFYDTLNHLPDVTALAAAVRGIAAGLRPAGLFVFDATNELGFDRWWRGNRAWHGRGWRVSIETAYDASARLAHAEVSIEDRARQTRTSLTERYFTDGEIQAALAAAGIDEVLRQPWSPFDNDAPGKTWWIGRNTPR